MTMSNPIATQIKKNGVTSDLHDHRLPSGLGTAGQVAKVNSAGTGMEWGDSSTGVTSYESLTDRPSINGNTLSGNVNLQTPLTAGSDYATPANVSSVVAGHNGSGSSHSDIRTAVSGKYTKPSGGIPDDDIASASTWNGKASSSDITSAVSTHNGSSSAHSDIRTAIPTKTSELANDSGFLTSHQDISGKENSSNKTTSISSGSTNDQYPSALAVYNYSFSKIGGGISGNVVINGNASDTPLQVKSAQSTTWIGFKNSSGTTMGYLGFNGSGVPAAYTNTSHTLAMIDDSSTSSTSATWSANKLNTVLGNVESLLAEI